MVCVGVDVEVECCYVVVEDFIGIGWDVDGDWLVDLIGWCIGFDDIGYYLYGWEVCECEGCWCVVWLYVKFCCSNLGYDLIWDWVCYD